MRPQQTLSRIATALTLVAALATSTLVTAVTRGDNAPVVGWKAAINHAMRDAADGPAARIAYHVMAGEMALSRQQMGVAAEQYAAALAINADLDTPVDAPADLAERTAKVAITADRVDLAYPAVQLWARHQPRDRAAQQAALELAFINDDADGVMTFAPRFLATVDGSPAARRQAYQQIADLLSGRPALAERAVTTAKTIRDGAADQTAANYMLAEVAFRYDDLATAGQAIKPVVESAPEWADAHLLAAFIQARNLDVESARATLAALDGKDRDKTLYHARLARYLLSIGETDAGLGEFETAVSLSPDNPDIQFGLALARLANNDTDGARQAFEALVDGPAHGDAAAFYLGRLAEDDDAPDAAMRYYGRVDQGDHRFEARARLAALQAETGQMETALATLDRLAESAPERRDDLLALKAELLMKNDQADRAVSLYDRALAHRPGQPDLLYGRALAYESAGDIPAAKADLEQILELEPDNAMALNALGYLLTEHSQDYARAESLIRRALASQPDDASMLDSLGWVQYKQGDLDAARTHLEKAYAASPHPEIAAHLGEVRWAQGDHDAARRIWRRAQTADSDNDTLTRTINAHRS